ncbi:MAG: T9SS type A sorting domain-containing protein [Bacteroidales bacterium]|nr:T9SS type A sorting domain-containing protein [Bacteroidales bacterium]
MKKTFLVIITLFMSFSAFSQLSTEENPYTYKLEGFNYQNITTLKVDAPDLQQVIEEDLENDKQNKMMRFGVIVPVYKDFFELADKKQTADGTVWTLSVESQDAEALIFYSDNFKLPRSGKFFVYNPERTKILGAFTQRNNNEFNTFATEYIEGEKIILEYYQPNSENEQPQIELTEIGYAYRGITKLSDEYRSSGDCNVNVNCSEGDNYRDQQRGVCRIQIRMSTYYIGWCTGTLINNTNYDLKPYLLTAAHCIEDVASTSYYSQFVFYFKYENSGCAVTSSEPSRSKSLTGTSVKAYDNTYGSNGSDFALLLLSDDPPMSYTPYWCGWDKRNRSVSQGVGIHHPSGDVKKISTFTTSLQNSSYGSSSATHWYVDWAETENGWGIMEGGSSGSALFNTDGRIIGSLTGGASGCDVSASYKYDVYGKMSWHWSSNGNTNSRKLDHWLDPSESGVNYIDGMDYNSSLTSMNQTENLVKLYPNPTKDEVNITLNQMMGETQIDIFDQAGRKIETHTTTNPSLTLSLKHLNEGVYTLKITNNNSTQTQQIILTK